MKTGGFSRFARKPGSKESARGNSCVGGISEELKKQKDPFHSNDEFESWNSSDFGGGFEFDAGFNEPSFEGGNVSRA